MNTKANIIDCSYSLFLSSSYETVTINDICKVLGLTKGALYYHFTSKEELFKRVVDKYFVMYKPLVVTENTTLACLIKNSLVSIEDTLDLLVKGKPDLTTVNYMNFICDVFRYYPSFAEQKQNWIELELGKIKYVLDNAILNGEIRGDIDTRLIAINYLSIIVGITSNVIYDGLEDFSLEMLQRQLDAFYKTLKS